MTIVRWVSGLALLSTAAAVGAASPSGQPAPAVPFPDGYRSWHVVKTMVVGPEHRSFARRGGIHHYYANAPAVEGYRAGTFPTGSVIVVEVLLAKDGEGDAKGILLEGDWRFVEVMTKNDWALRRHQRMGIRAFRGRREGGAAGGH